MRLIYPQRISSGWLLLFLCLTLGSVKAQLQAQAPTGKDNQS